MAVLQRLARQVSIDLNDYATGHEFTTWSEEQINTYLIEGLQVAFTFRPDLFLHSVVVELDAGSNIQRPCNCTLIRRVYGISTKDGRLLYGLRKRKSSERLQWYGKTCPADPAHYRARDYYIDSEEDTFFIEPAPPVGKTTYALLECAQAPTAEDLANGYEIPVELEAPAIQWALYRAKMIDGENNSTIYQVANAHKQTCFDLLRAQLALNDSIEVDHATPGTTQVKV